MSSKQVVAWSLAAMLMATGAAVQAQQNSYMSSDTVDVSKVKVPGVDKDGDGCLDKSEVTPGGQLDKRFATRDANGDGKLCKDEYFAP